MNKQKYAIVTISKPYGEGKALMQNEDDMAQSISIEMEKSEITKDILLRIPLEAFQKEKEVLPVQLFEEQLDLTPEQLLAFYSYWSTTPLIVLKYTAMAIKSDKAKANEIITLAYNYDLLTGGKNCTHKLKDALIKDRWKSKIAEMKKEHTQKDRVETGEMTVQEALEGAKKDMGMKVKPIPVKKIESPVAVISEDEMHDPAREAKLRERARYDEESKKAQEALLGPGIGEVKHSSLRKIDSKKIPVTLPVKKTTKGLSVKSSSQAIPQGAVTPRKIR
jgi:hypothetical protein